MNRWIVLLAIPPVLAFASPAHAGGRPDGEFAWLNAYTARSYTLRPSVNANPFVYVPITRDFATLEMKGSLFPLLGPERITVRKVELDTKLASVEMEFVSEHGDKGSLRFLSPRNSTEAMGQRHLDALLALVTEDAGVLPYVANASSGVLHFKGSNHVRGIEAGAEYGDTQSALADGMALCKSCFAPIHLLPDYEKEVALGRQVAVDVRSSYPAVTDAAVQQRVRATGERVLARWPLPLRGYQYRFTVLEASSPNAVACPGGWILVYEGLLDLCESDLELEAVLAHEISHVEMRHGLRQMRSAEKAARLGTIAGAVLIGVGASQDNGAAVAVAGGVAAILASTATELALAGYSRDMEMESDAAAVHYLVSNNGEAQRDHLARVLSKLEYYGECETGHRRETNEFSSHPAGSVRSGFAADAETVFFSEPPAFAFTTDDGARYTLEVFGICHYAYYMPMGEVQYEDQHSYEFGLGGSVGWESGVNRTDTLIFATVMAGSGIDRGTEFKDMDLQMDGQWVKFDNKEDTILYPNSSTSMVLVHRGRGLYHYTSLVPTQVKHSGQAVEAEKKDRGEDSSNSGLR